MGLRRLLRSMCSTRLLVCRFVEERVRWVPEDSSTRPGLEDEDARLARPPADGGVFPEGVCPPAASPVFGGEPIGGALRAERVSAAVSAVAILAGIDSCFCLFCDHGGIGYGGGHPLMPPPRRYDRLSWSIRTPSANVALSAEATVAASDACPLWRMNPLRTRAKLVACLRSFMEASVEGGYILRGIPGYFLWAGPWDRKGCCYCSPVVTGNDGWAISGLEHADWAMTSPRRR